MPTPPPCTGLGRQCRELRLTLKIAGLGDPAHERDAAGTWLLGHTERIAFGTPYKRHGMLLVDAVVRVPCKYLEGREAGRQGSRCRAHGFRGTLPDLPAADPARVQVASDRFTVFHRGTVRALTMPLPNGSRRALPVMNANPCAGAPCRTADNTRGAACCRDLTLDVVVPLGDERTELLLRARTPPYLCKVKRADETIIECEVISACGYLDPADGVSCVLHGRTRPDGQPAKPDICFDWPDFDKNDKDFTGHPGCVFLQ